MASTSWVCGRSVLALASPESLFSFRAWKPWSASLKASCSARKVSYGEAFGADADAKADGDGEDHNAAPPLPSVVGVVGPPVAKVAGARLPCAAFAVSVPDPIPVVVGIASKSYGDLDGDKLSLG